MNETDKTVSSDPDLWRRYRGDGQGLSGSQAPADPLDSLELAAYLDGTLSEAERKRVEARLARSPDDLEVVLAARDALADAGGPAPDGLVSRACALLPEARAGGGLLPGLAAGRSGFWRPVAWSGAAAAVLLACGLGFQLGQSGYAGVLSVERLQAVETVTLLGSSAEDFL